MTLADPDTMTALDKARGAMAEAKALTAGLPSSADLTRDDQGRYGDLLAIAAVQAAIARAEATERMADTLERLGGRFG